MTAPVTGAPIGPDIERPLERIVYDHLPKLHELLHHEGWPGVVYAQCLVRNLKHANDRVEQPGHMRPIRGASYYSIEGPAGVADMALVGSGSPIPGAAPEAGARFFFTDGEVAEETGFPVDQEIWFTSKPVEPEIVEPERTPAEAVAAGRRRVDGKFAKEA